MGSDNNEQDAANNDAARSKIRSLRSLTVRTCHLQTFSPAKKTHCSERSKHMPAEDDGEQSEYGDAEIHAIDVATSEFSPHQFIAPDEARVAMGSDDTEQDAANIDVDRSKILAAVVFDSEDVPSPDNFLQIPLISTSPVNLQVGHPVAARSQPPTLANLDKCRESPSRTSSGDFATARRC